MDVIGLEREPHGLALHLPRTSAPGRFVVLLAGLALTAAALMGHLVGRTTSTGRLPGSGTVAELTGRLVLDLQEGAYALDSAWSYQPRHRELDGKGRSP